MQTEASRQLVLSYYEALASGNPADLEEILSDDVVWAPPTSAPIDGPFEGCETVLKARVVRINEHNDSLHFHRIIMSEKPRATLRRKERTING